MYERLALLKVCMEITQKAKNRYTISPSYRITGIFPMDSISYYRDICSSMFIAMVLTKARKAKQPRYYRTTGKCAIIECYSAMKKNIIVKFTGKWMEL